MPIFIAASLTTGIETVNAGNQDVNGVINGANSTYQTGDTINNAKNINVTIAAPSGEAGGPLVTINNTTAVNFRTLAASPVNGTLFTNVGTVGSSQSTNVLTINNGALASTYALSNTVSGNQDGLAVGIRSGDVTGTSNTINFSVAGVGTGNTAAVGSPANTVRSLLSTTTTGIENIAIATAGTNRLQFTGDTTAATDSVLLTITGSGTNDISVANRGLATTSTISAATATGTLTLNVNAGLTTGDTIVGGTGTSDTLQATISGSVATGLAVSAIETLRISAGANGGTLGFTTNPGFTTVRIDAVAAAGNAGAAANQLLNAGGFTTLNLVGNSTTASATAANNFNGLTATGGYTGAADTLTVNLSNGGVTLGAGASYGVAAITTTGVESYVLNVTDSTANTFRTTFTAISDSATTSITANSNGSVVLTDVGNIAATAGVLGNLTTINMAGVTGTNEVSTVRVFDNSLAAAAAVTAGAGGLTLTVAAESRTDVLTFTGGIGADTLTAATFVGNIIANLGAGVDTFTIGAAAAATMTGGQGADVFALSNTGGINTITDFGLGGDVQLVNTAGITTATVVANVTLNANSGVAANSVTLNMASGVTTVNAGAAAAGTLGFTINANASTASTITGGRFADTINGSGLADTITNQAAAGVRNSAADVITGGAGNDTFILYGSNASDVIATVYGATSRVTDFAVGTGAAGSGDVVSLSRTPANYLAFNTVITSIQGEVGVAGTTSIQTVAQNANAAALVAGTDLIKLTTAITPAGNLQQAFDAAMGTATVTGFGAVDTGVFVAMYDAAAGRMNLLLASTGAGIQGTTLAAADVVQLVGSMNMSAGDFATFNIGNLAIVA